MQPLNKQALVIALLPTIFVSFLAQAYIGSDAGAGATSVEAHEPIEGDAKVTLTSTDCGTEPQHQGSTERFGDPPPSFLAP